MAIDSATSLLFKIGANTDDATENISRFRSLFGTSLSDLSTQFEGFAAELTGGGDKINASFTAMASIAAGAAVGIAAGLFEAAKKTAEFGEQLLLMSQQVGMSVTQLSGLKVVSEQMGISFDTLARGVAIMDRSLSPFASSGATAAKALASIGVSATDANGQLRPNIDLLADVADKFANMDDGANKTALAMSVFGRSGAEMIPILDRGGDALRQAAAEGQKFGLVLDQAAAEKSAKFEEATRDLSMTLDGLVTEIGLKVIPAFTDGLNVALLDARSALSWFGGHETEIKSAFEVIALAVAALTSRTIAATAAQLALSAATTVITGFSLLTPAVLASAAALGVWAAAAAAAAYGAYKIIDAVNQLRDAQEGAREAWANAAKGADEEAHATARLDLAIQQVTGHMVEGATMAERVANSLKAYNSATAEQKRQIDALIHTQHDKQAADRDAIVSLSTLTQAYQSVQQQVQALQDQESKPRAAAEAQYQRGLAAAQKQLDAYKKQIAAGKKTDETLAQYEQEYYALKAALAQRYQLTLDQISKQEADKASQLARQLQTTAAAASAAATAMWQKQGDAALAAINAQIAGDVKQAQAAHDVQTSVDAAAKKLTDMAQQSTNVTLSAGEKIRAEYAKQIQAINAVIAAQSAKGLTDQQAAQLATAAAAAETAAANQETDAQNKLRQQQMQTATTSVDSFLQMGLAAAGYRSAVVTALMQVIKVLEAEMIAHITSAAGAAAAENVKNIAVGKGVGIRSVWHAAEQFALGLADAATLNFAGAAAHFGASAAFASVAASVGTAVAGLFAGSGGGSSTSATSTKTTSAASTAASTKAGATAAAQPSTVINLHLDGMVSPDNLATVMAQMTGLVQGGQAHLGASHIMSSGALVATK